MNQLNRSPEPAPGTHLGPYQVDLVLGRGATAIVLGARLADSDEAVALKVARDAAASSDFEHEIRALEQLRRTPHPGIVRLLAAGNGVHGRWLALERLAGQSLQSRLTRMRGAAPDSVRIGGRIAEALVLAHSLGLVHGDISTANVLFRDNEPVLIDWALARTCSVAGVLTAHVAQGLGTPGFIAPERLRGEAYDSRADLYGLGCLLYALFTGRPPFISDDEHALARSHLLVDPPPLSSFASGISRELDRLVLGLLEKDPSRRTPYAAQVALRLLGDPGAAREVACKGLPVFRPRVVERTEGLDALEGSLRGVAGRGLTLTLVCGPAGSGRTRVLEELGTAASHAGFSVLSVGAFGRSAVQPLAALDPLLDLAAARLERSPERAREAAELAALCPYSASLLGVLGSGTETRETARSCASLYRALLACIELVSRETPLCLLVDTLEAVGDLVSGFLATLCDKVGAEIACLIVIATSRRDLRWQNVLSYNLPALSERGVLAMLSDMIASVSLGARLGSIALRATAGHPKQVVEFATRIVREGAVLLDAETGALEVDESLAQELTRKWEALPVELTAPTTRLAACAAAAGAVLDIPLLERVLRETDPHLAIQACLAELVAEGIVVEDEGRYRFAHESFRLGAAAQASEADRQRFHEHLALALQKHPYGLRDYLQIGRHWAATEHQKRAVACLALGARRAESALLLSEAVDALEQALSVSIASQTSAWPWSMRTTRLGLRLVEVLSRSGVHAQLVTSCQRLLSNAPTRANFARARSATLLAQSCRVVSDYERSESALAIAETYVSRAAATQSLRLNRAWLDIQLVGSFTAYSRRDLETMKRRLDALAVPVRAWGTPEQRAGYFMWCANYDILRRRYASNARAVRLERHALRILKRVDARSRESLMCQFDLAFMQLLGDRAACAEAAALLSDAETNVVQLGDAVLLARIATYQAIALRRLRDVTQCERYASASLERAAACGLRGYMGAAAGCLAWIALRRADSVRTRQLCDQAELHFAGDRHAITEYPFQWLSLFPRLAIELADDRLEQARETLHGLLRRNQAVLAAPVNDALKALAETWDGLDDGTIARRLASIVRLATQHCYL